MCVCVTVFCVGDDPLGISRERGLYSMLHKHSQRSTGESTSQSVPGLKAKASPPPITMMILTHTHTDMGMHVSYTYAQRHIGECFHTHTHTHTQGLPLSPSHTQLSSVPSLCLFMATPVLIPSHSISITSANSPSSSARTVFLLPSRLHLCPLVSFLCILQAVFGVI